MALRQLERESRRLRLATEHDQCGARTIGHAGAGIGAALGASRFARLDHPLQPRFGGILGAVVGALAQTPARRAVARRRPIASAATAPRALAARRDTADAAVRGRGRRKQRDARCGSGACARSDAGTPASAAARAASR